MPGVKDHDDVGLLGEPLELLEFLKNREPIGILGKENPRLGKSEFFRQHGLHRPRVADGIVERHVRIGVVADDEGDPVKSDGTVWHQEEQEEKEEQSSGRSHAGAA